MDQEHIAVGFPMVLYNGERQVYIGKIEINRTINFQEFRTILKQKIGVSYNNLTTCLVDNHRPKSPRKILITSKVNFMVLLQEKTNAFFLVVIKRSRRDRRRKPCHRNCTDLFEYGYDYETDVSDSINEAYPVVEKLETRALCGDCMQANEKGVKPEFHLCL